MSTNQSAGSAQNFDIEKKAQELLEETDSDSRIRSFVGRLVNCWLAV